MNVIIDNYDSFTLNLVQYIGENDSNVVVYKNDEVFEQFLSYQARLTYQKLLDKVFKLKGPK